MRKHHLQTECVMVEPEIAVNLDPIPHCAVGRAEQPDQRMSAMAGPGGMSPEQVWEAIATGPGISSWFMGPHEIEPGVGGTVTLTIGDFSERSTITAWDPLKRLAYRGAEGADGSFHAMEYLIEGRRGSSTVLRFVHSGFLSDDSAAEFEDQTSHGWDRYLHTLAQYLTYFSGRPGTYVYSGVSGATTGLDAWTVLTGGLGLTGPVRPGDVGTVADPLAALALVVVLHLDHDCPTGGRGARRREPSTPPSSPADRSGPPTRREAVVARRASGTPRGRPARRRISRPPPRREESRPRPAAWPRGPPRRRRSPSPRRRRDATATDRRR